MKGQVIAVGRSLWLLALAFALTALAACSLNPFRREDPTLAPMAPAPTLTRAPTLTPVAPTATVSLAPTMTAAPSATPNVGILDARYVSDVTIPDGYAVAPGEAFQKIWEIRNEGEVAWPEGTVLQHVSGPTLGPVESVSLRPREPGEIAEVAVEMVAPSEPGLYTSYWQLCVDEQCFGSRIWVQIRVQAEE